MDAGTPFTYGPVFVAGTYPVYVFLGTNTGPGDGINVPAANSGVLVKHIRIVNTTPSPAFINLKAYGLTAGPIYICNQQRIEGNSYHDWYGSLWMGTSTSGAAAYHLLATAYSGMPAFLMRCTKISDLSFWYWTVAGNPDWAQAAPWAPQPATAYTDVGIAYQYVAPFAPNTLTFECEGEILAI